MLDDLCQLQVEMYVFTEHPKPIWEYTGSVKTDKHGKALFDVTGTYSPGLYPIKFLVK